MKYRLFASAFALSLGVLGCTTTSIPASIIAFDNGVLVPTNTVRAVGFSRAQPTSAIGQTWLCDNQQDTAREILTLKECKILIDNSTISSDGRRVVNVYALKKNRKAWTGLSTRAVEALTEYEAIQVGGPSETPGQVPKL